MKNSTKLFNIIALAVIIEFGITACYNTSFESKEIKTSGRLTITGLNAYEGKAIIVYLYYADDSVLFACGRIEEQFFNGEIVDNYIFNGTISNGQTSLKVYYIKGFEGFSYDDGYKGEAEGYSGNDKGVYFNVKNGYALVNFTNGKGTGVFKQGGLYNIDAKNQYINLSGITGTNIVDKAVNYVNANPKDDKNDVINYTFRLDSDIDLTANTYRILTAGNLTIIGLDRERKIKLTSAGSIFNVGVNSELTLDDNITLVGYNGNSSPVVNVTGGTFNMKGNTKITGNTNSGNGGGVYVNSGKFYMSDNSSISGNTSSANGGGVYVNDGTFSMTGRYTVVDGKSSYISNASISGNTSFANGGGVYVNGGVFYMLGNASIISGNTSSVSGGGIYVGDKGSFNMRGGTIYGSNETSSLANKASSGAALGRASSSSTATYGNSYPSLNILPHTDGQQLYTNNTIVGK
jgi:hypothetical protein